MTATKHDAKPATSPTQVQTVAKGRKRSWRRLLLSPEAGAASVLLAMAAVFAVLEPTRFATPRNLINVLADASPLSILAMATTLILVSRNIDLSIGGIIAFAEVVSAMSMTENGGPAVAVLGLVVGIAAGAVWGAVNGMLVTRARVPSFVATLATLGMAQGAAYVISNGNDVDTVPQVMINNIGVGRLVGIPVLV
ncbi:MAG: ABC transporter permease, partial [Mycobacterium sp.]|nr:ABC transporter permease [Mycobacterium sp.]